MIRMVLAPCSPFTVTKDLMIKAAELARKYKGVRLHTHMAENQVSAIARQSDSSLSHLSDDILMSLSFAQLADGCDLESSWGWIVTGVCVLQEDIDYMDKMFSARPKAYIE